MGLLASVSLLLLCAALQLGLALVLAPGGAAPLAMRPLPASDVDASSTIRMLTSCEVERLTAARAPLWTRLKAARMPLAERLGAVLPARVSSFPLAAAAGAGCWWELPGRPAQLSARDSCTSAPASSQM